jgi:hypothetical protein
MGGGGEGERDFHYFVVSASSWASLAKVDLRWYGRSICAKICQLKLNLSPQILASDTKSAQYTPFLLHWTISPPHPLTLSPPLPYERE